MKERYENILINIVIININITQNGLINLLGGPWANTVFAVGSVDTQPPLHLFAVCTVCILLPTNFD